MVFIYNHDNFTYKTFNTVEFKLIKYLYYKNNKYLNKRIKLSPLFTPKLVN